MSSKTTTPPTIAELAHEVRSKNAGPFWVTMELFMHDAQGYRIAADKRFINESLVAQLYQVAAKDVQIFRIPDLNVVKISFPRPVPQASLHDRDSHSGQHHVPLAQLPIPAKRGRSPRAGLLNRRGLKRQGGLRWKLTS